MMFDLFSFHFKYSHYPQNKGMQNKYYFTMIFGFSSLNIILECIFWPEHLNAQTYILVTTMFISWNNILKKIQCNYSLEFSGFWHVRWLSRPNIILGHVVLRCVSIILARCLYIDLIYILNSLYYIWNIIGFHTLNMWKKVVLLKNKFPPPNQIERLSRERCAADCSQASLSAKIR
jgi:hypothetical protein